MVRLFIIAIFLAAFAGIVVILATIGTSMITAGDRRLRHVLRPAKDDVMATSGIQKAAYIALIIVLFGVASGWLGGL